MAARTVSARLPHPVGTVGTTTMTVHATNVLTDEAAGASINIADATRGSNLAVLDPGGNGSAARPRRWQFNGCEISAGLPLTATNGYTWTPSLRNLRIPPSSRLNVPMHRKTPLLQLANRNVS